MEYTEVPVEKLEINKKYKLVIYGDPTYTTGILSSIQDEMLVFNKMRFEEDEADQKYLIHYDNYKIYRTRLNCIQFYIPKNKELAQQSMEWKNENFE